MAAKSLPFRLLLLLPLLVVVRAAVPTPSPAGGIPRPVGMAEWGMKSVLIEEASRGRRLSSFQICALCTCCGGPRGLCLPSPCCYSINCNIPNRPFGFCAFTPKTCNCFGCHL